MAKSQIPIVGLIGGVGCGKTAVANWLAEHIRAHVVDADAVGHAVLRRDDVKSRLRDAFGEDVFNDGEISRSQIAARVFGGSAEQAAARRTLEEIVHPVMRTVFEAAFQSAREAADIDLIAFDAAVLLESGWSDAVDVIAFVDLPAGERLRRVATGRGWSADEFHRREASQLTLPEKRAAADVVIDNSGSVEAAGRELETYLRDAGHLPHAATPNTSNQQLVN